MLIHSSSGQSGCYLGQDRWFWLPVSFTGPRRSHRWGTSMSHCMQGRTVCPCRSDGQTLVVEQRAFRFYIEQHSLFSGLIGKGTNCKPLESLIKGRTLWPKQ